MLTMLNFLIALVIFGLIVFVHELGHFVAGRLCGIAVSEFSLGFGPQLFGFRRGLTYYAIRLIPLGGYCRFIGEDEPERFWPVPSVVGYKDDYDGPVGDLRPGDIITQIDGQPVSFDAEGVDVLQLTVRMGTDAPHTLQVERDGALVTVALRPALVDGEWQLGLILGKVDDGALPRVVHCPSSARNASLLPGDVIVKAGGHAVIYDASGCARIDRLVKRAAPGGTIDYVVERGGQLRSISVPVDISPDGRSPGFLMGATTFPLPGDDALPPRSPLNAQPVWKRLITYAAGPFMNFLLAFVVALLFFVTIGQSMIVPRVAEIMPGLNAEKAGMRVDDVIVSVMDEEIPFSPEGGERMMALIQTATLGQPIDFVVERDGQRLPIAVATPEADQNRLIGITVGTALYPVPLGQSLQLSMVTVRMASTLIVDALRKMITTGEGLDQTAGPVGLLSVMTEQIQNGLGTVLSLIVNISINLGLMNLLPLPALDGGRLVFALIEGVRRKPLKAEHEGLIHAVGFFLIMGLFVVITYRDIVKLFTGG